MGWQQASAPVAGVVAAAVAAVGLASGPALLRRVKCELLLPCITDCSGATRAGRRGCRSECCWWAFSW